VEEGDREETVILPLFDSRVGKSFMLLLLHLVMEGSECNLEVSDCSLERAERKKK